MVALIRRASVSSAGVRFIGCGVAAKWVWQLLVYHVVFSSPSRCGHFTSWRIPAAITHFIWNTH